MQTLNLELTGYYVSRMGGQAVHVCVAGELRGDINESSILTFQNGKPIGTAEGALGSM